MGKFPRTQKKNTSKTLAKKRERPQKHKRKMYINDRNKVDFRLHRKMATFKMVLEGQRASCVVES